ncbi:MAG TPA: hypothetical protein PLC80_13510 [Draconibacterium sp.]|nr:hypothetical protein [Draconibacterium sp.]
MKEKMFFIIVLMVGLAAVNVNAQSLKIPKVDGANTLVLPADKAGFEKDFLSALDPGTDLGISADKLGKLATKNKSFVGDVMTIMGGKGTDNEKLAKIGLKNTDLTKFATELLGSGTAGKYFEKVQKQLGPLRTKYNLAKLLM